VYEIPSIYDDRAQRLTLRKRTAGRKAYQSDRERHLDRCHDYYDRNAAERREYARAYRVANREKIAARRSAARRAAAG
jgi:hypothetical protein